MITGGEGTQSSPYTLSYTRPELAEKDDLQELDDLYRYRGENPNNWVCFGSSSITNPSNCDASHKWRIIGIDSAGRMKIMTNYYYSTKSSFDVTGGTSYGSNIWGRPADLKTVLNGSAFYSNNSYIDSTHRGYITNATWYTGGESPAGRYTLQNFITGEKSSNTTGYVGLMSVVDFGYASSSCTTRTVLATQNNPCMSNNWIGYSNYQWTISPFGNNPYTVWYVDPTRSRVSGQYAYNNTIGVRPVVCLDANIKIMGGNGTESSPYILSK